MLIGKQQEQILESLTEEERLHLVPGHHIAAVGYVRDGGEAVFDAAMFVKGLQHFPSPVLVHGVAGETMQDEIRLRCLRPQQVVLVTRLHGTRMKTNKS